MIFPVRFVTGVRFTGRTNVSSTLSRLVYCQTGNACKSATVSESTTFIFSIIVRGIHCESSSRGAVGKWSRPAIRRHRILRQTPGTAKQTTFMTLVDETGIVQVILWNSVAQQY